MKSGIKGLLIFAIGVCTGAAGTYFYFREKFDKELNKEVQKVKNYMNAVDHYSGETFVEVPEESKEQSREVAAQEKPSLFDYAKLSSQKHKNTSETPPVSVTTSFHLVSPERFEDLSYEYQTQDLIAYRDGVITDTQDNVLYRSFESFVPNSSIDDFDEDGYLYVADDAISRLYEVSLDNRTYADVFDTED